MKWRNERMLIKLPIIPSGRIVYDSQFILADALLASHAERLRDEPKELLRRRLQFVQENFHSIECINSIVTCEDQSSIPRNKEWKNT